jgi:flagellar basal body-associated protein FliL
MAASKPDSAAQESTPAPTLKRKLILPLMVGGIMLVEGVVIFLLVRISSPEPPPAQAAAEGLTAEQQIEALDPEVSVAECDAINRASGQTVVVHIALSALVSPPNVDRAQKLIEKRKNTIQDRVQLVVRGADPKHLNEPGLETIRRQLKMELDKILGDDKLLNEILVPQILQTRSSL